MERQELQEKYEAGDLDDPTELQRFRDEVHRFTGLQVPRSVAEIEEWWTDNKSVFSRRIKPSDVSQADNQDNEGENE